MDFFADIPEKLYFCSKNIFCGMNGIEESLKTYRDLKNSLDTAEEKGEAKEKKATIRRLLASGASVDIISIATGLPEVDVRLLIDEISKE